MTANNIIRNQDWFGFPITLNFNKKGSTHQSVLGGSVSIIIKTVIFLYCLVLVKTLFHHEDDTLRNVKVQTDPDDLGDITLKEMSFFPVVMIFSISENKYVKKSDYERYIEVRLG